MQMTFDSYARLLDGLRRSGRRVGGVAGFLESPSPDAVILRHDVDRRPRKAVSLARLEAERGLSASYYFRVSAGGRLATDAIDAVSALGHEVGYHYETLAECRGDREAALALFVANLERIRAICPCRTVSMHGRPLSRFDNVELLRGEVLDAFDLLGDATLSIERHDPIYFTDVGGSWNHPTANLRDRVGRAPGPGGDLADPTYLEQVLAIAHRPLYVNAHPERWADGPMDAVYCRSRDRAINLVKRVIARTRW